jgi:hypothetical protein
VEVSVQQNASSLVSTLPKLRRAPKASVEASATDSQPSSPGTPQPLPPARAASLTATAAPLRRSQSILKGSVNSNAGSLHGSPGVNPSSQPAHAAVAARQSTLQLAARMRRSSSLSEAQSLNGSAMLHADRATADKSILSDTQDLSPRHVASWYKF